MNNANMENISIRTILDAKKGKVENIFDTWFKYQVRTPGSALSFYFKSNESGNGIVQTVCSETIEMEVVQKVILWADAEGGLHKESSAFQVLPIENSKSNQLDCILSIPAEYHRYNLEFGVEVHSNTTVFFPCNHIEFMADETKGTFNAIRDTLHLTDWLRESQPRVSMRYSNPRMKSESKGKNLGVTRYPYALMHIENLWGAEGGFMELQNYRAVKATLKPTESAMEVRTSSDGNIVLNSIESLLGWSTNFLKS